MILNVSSTMLHSRKKQRLCKSSEFVISIMNEKELTRQIRISYGISLLQAITRSLGVILTFSILVLLSDLLSLAGSSVPVAVLLLVVLIVLNNLGYIELSVSSPRKGSAYHLIQGCEDGNWLAFLSGWILILDRVLMKNPT